MTTSLTAPAPASARRTRTGRWIPIVTAALLLAGFALTARRRTVA